MPALTVAPHGAASAQAFPGDTAAPVVIERITRDRWIHEGRAPAFVPPTRTEEFVHLRSSRPSRSDSGPFLWMRVGNARGSLSLGPRNHVRVGTLDLPPIPFSRWEDAEGRAAARVRRLSGRGALQNLPETRLREIPFPVPGTTLRPGVAWTDTIDFVADPGEGLSERFEGLRHNRVVGDTLIGGRRLPRVRFEETLRYRSVEKVDDPAFDGMFAIERDARGTTAGFAVVDTMRGVRAGGADTTAWEGTAVLRTPEGAAHPAGVRYERVRTWALRDSASWADSMRAARDRRSTGMLVLPTDSLQIRLRAGDRTAVDSLFERWRASDDAAERQEIEALLGRWSSRTPEEREAFVRRMSALREEAGDTVAWIVEALAERGPRLTADRLERLLPYLDDPGRLWRMGILPRWTYTSLADRVLAATPILEPDSSRWACEPEACRRLAALRDDAREPRLRDVALLASFARDPARWTGSLRSRADSGSALARRGLVLADGVGATWPAAPKTAMPETGADWRVWLAWLGGSVRFENSHRVALRYYWARTGRDPVEELRRAWPPEGDSARLVAGTILEAMDALGPPDPDSLAAAFRSGDEARIELARRRLRPTLRREGAEAGPELGEALLGPLVDSLLAGAPPPWPAPEERADAGPPVFPHFSAVPGEDLPRFVLREGLPDDVALRVPPRAEVVDSAAWAARPARAGGVLLRVMPVRAWGDFASLRWNWTVLRRRAPDEAPSGYAGGGGLMLLRTAEGWVVVATDAWIT